MAPTKRLFLSENNRKKRGYVVSTGRGYGHWKREGRFIMCNAIIDVRKLQSNCKLAKNKNNKDDKRTLHVYGVRTE